MTNGAGLAGFGHSQPVYVTPCGENQWQQCGEAIALTIAHAVLTLYGFCGRVVPVEIAVSTLHPN